MIVEALAREVGEVGKLLHKLSAKQWDAPTRCAPMTVFDLAAHVYRGALRVNEMLDAEPLDVPPEKDAVTYFQYDPAAEGPEIVARAQEVAASFGSAKALVQAWDTEWSRALRRAREADLRAVGPTVFGLMTREEYLKTRCVEVLIHHMDLDDALGRPVHPDAGCLTVVGDVLRGLLGTDLRPVGMDDVRFALAGTGRAALTDEERAYLGPLAEKFPLLA